MAATPSASFVTRQSDKHVLSVEQSEGLGARVRRSIGRPELRNFDPFLMLDEFKAGNKGGFPSHPHRGFETVTFVLPHSTGSFRHEDFVGNKGILGPGDLQWMTAGRGIVHSEMPHMKDGEIAHGLQLWVNLPKADKMCEPRYQELPASKVTKVKQGGVEAHVIAGTALGTTSPVYTRNPVEYIYFKMDANTRLEHKIPKGFNSFLYTFDGEISVGTSDKRVEGHYTVTLTNDPASDGVVIRTHDRPASFVLLAGKPINEKVVQHGPFVLSSQEELMQAFEDYSEGKNGFERAPGFRASIDPVDY